MNRKEKYDPSKSQGHDAGVTKMKADFDTGAKILRELTLAIQVIMDAKELDSMRDIDDDDAKAKLQKKIAETERKLGSKGRDLIAEGQKSLQNRADTVRKRLGSDAWSLRYYDQPVSQKTLEELGIVPTMGKVIGRGQTGKDITR